jgi:hypothetical protein
MLERSFLQAYLLGHGNLIEMLADHLALTYFEIAILAVVGDLTRSTVKKRRASAAADRDEQLAGKSG